MEKRPRSTARSIAEWLPVVWALVSMALAYTGLKLAPLPTTVYTGILGVIIVSFVGVLIYHAYHQQKHSNIKNELRTEVLKMLACHSYEWSEPTIHGIRDIYAVELSERSDVNEYMLTIYSTHLGVLIGFKGANIDLIQSVIDDIFGYKIKIELKEPTLFKNLHKKD